MEEIYIIEKNIWKELENIRNMIELVEELEN